MRKCAPLFQLSRQPSVPVVKRPWRLLRTKLLTAIAILTGTVTLTMSVPAMVSAQTASSPLSCDLVQGSVHQASWERWAGLNVAVNPAAAYDRSYNVVLYNPGPVGLRSIGVLAAGTTSLDVTFDAVDLGYSTRRAVERSLPATFTAAIAPSSETPTAENSTLCTGNVSWIDNPIDGSHFVVGH